MPIKSAAGVQELPFRLLPRSDDVPIDGCYKVEIEDEYRNDNPIFDGATCGNTEFILVWFMMFKLFGFLKTETKFKSIRHILYERDCTLLATYRYFDIEYKGN